VDAVPSGEALLDRLQRGALGYFLEAVNPANGLIAGALTAACISRRIRPMKSSCVDWSTSVSSH
jgi:hypothetical protein